MISRLLWIAVAGQWLAVGAQLWLPSPYGPFVQVVAALLMVAVVSAYCIQRVRLARHRYKDIQRARAEQEMAFRTFVRAHLQSPDTR